MNIPGEKDEKMMNMMINIMNVDVKDKLTWAVNNIDQLNPILKSTLLAELENQFSESQDRPLQFAHAVLYGTDLTGLHFRNVNFSQCDFSKADLTGSTFQNCKLTGAWFEDTVLVDVTMSHCDLSGASFPGANLFLAHMDKGNYEYVDFKCSNMRGVTFYDINFRSCKFTNATFDAATKFDEVSMSKCDLSGAKGLIDPSKWMQKNFKRNRKGYIVYKAIHARTDYSKPEHWIIQPGSILTEVVNDNRSDHCGCGINFATVPWIVDFYGKEDIWECLIPFKELVSVVVPYTTHGKARCSHLELIRKLTCVEVAVLDNPSSPG